MHYFPSKESYQAPNVALVRLPRPQDLLEAFSAEADFEDFVVGDDL